MLLLRFDFFAGRVRSVLFFCLVFHLVPPLRDWLLLLLFVLCSTQVRSSTRPGRAPGVRVFEQVRHGRVHDVSKQKKPLLLLCAEFFLIASYMQKIRNIIWSCLQGPFKIRICTFVCRILHA